MSSTMAYRIALPTPWEHVPVGPGRDERIGEIVADAVRRLPPGSPPDQVAQGRIRLTEMLRKQLRECEANGGLDYYVPTDMMRGVRIHASFLVSEVLPDTSAPDGLTGSVLASLASSGGAPVTVGDTVWIRTDEVARRAPDAVVSDEVVSRRIDYVTALPTDERRWYVVSFTTVGDGDPHGEISDALVELFDAIMSTWRWERTDD